ncbi:hypothetical protein SP99_02013 [Enterobacter sp. BIDMC92]|uniref:hypothetical protein n=1 Tax=Enterobacter sp. BIDMC92 TaxID=1594172 RepID=UPI00065872D8|nr:hypothetical protein [Enterobacter sp. BIDMC92]KLW91793.1 hypothetical protein SP99_02013 [Enterobacter sp. BIDMC92]
MKRLLIAALMGLALAGCDNANQHVNKFTCTAGNGEVFSINARDFPERVSINGNVFGSFDQGHHENGTYETQYTGLIDGVWQSLFITKYDHPYWYAIRYLATSGSATISFSDRVQLAWNMATSHFLASYSNNQEHSQHVDSMDYYDMPCNPSQVDL